VVIGKGTATRPPKPDTAGDSKEWPACALDFAEPSRNDTSETDFGSILLDAPFEGRVYVLGLLIYEPQQGLTNYKYGYNLVLGKLDRDCTHFANPQEEAMLSSQICGHAILRYSECAITLYLEMIKEKMAPRDIGQAAMDQWPDRDSNMAIQRSFEEKSNNAFLTQSALVAFLNGTAALPALEISLFA
jgi:hypothetical protein